MEVFQHASCAVKQIGLVSSSSAGVGLAMSYNTPIDQQWQMPHQQWQGEMPVNKQPALGAMGGGMPMQTAMLGLPPQQAEGMLYGHVPVSNLHHPLVSNLVGQDKQVSGPPPEYGSSSSILYAIDGSRSSIPSGSQGATGSFRRMYASGTMGSVGDPNMSLGSRSDYAYLGPHPISGGAAHSVESLLEMIAALPPHQDCAQVAGPALQHLDSSALAALMKELGRAGLFKRSVELFDFLRRQTSPEFTHLLDIYTYTTAIATCSSSQQLQRALDLMAEMRARGITCNVHTYSALMNVCIKCNEVGLVQQVYNQMIQEGCTPNLVTYNTLIDLYVKTGQWQEAIKLLDKLEEEVRGGQR